MKGIRPVQPARIGRVVAVAGLAAVLASATGASAHAQAQATLEAFVRNVTIPTTGPGVVERVLAFSSEPVELEQIVITFDFSDIATFATVSESEPGSTPACSTAGDVLTCESSFGTAVDPIAIIGPDIVIAATAAAAEGDEGILRVTVQADDYAPLSHDARVRAGSPVNLAAGPPAEREAEVGESFSHVLEVTNTSDTEVNGVGVTLLNDRAFRAGEKFSNCTYDGDRPRACHFDQVLSPDTTYEVTIPYVVALDTFAPSNQGAEFQWLTSAEFEDVMDQAASIGSGMGQPGTGSVLELTEVATFAAARVEADVEPSDNWTSLLLSVTGENTTDLAAVGDTLTGGKTDLITAEFGIRNNGPATIDRGRAGSSAGRVYVTVPPGTTATAVPESCLPETEDGQQDIENRGQPGHPRYVCHLTSFVLPAGDSAAFEITLHIDKVIADAAGTVSILKPCACEDLRPELDLDHSNNIAQILVNPTEPPLADTGNRVGTIVALGVLLLLLGTAAVLAMRRRPPVGS